MPSIQVFKFGGASVKDAASVQNVANIIRNYRNACSLVVVVSAMGKTTNALEVLVNKATAHTDFSKEFEQLKQFHTQICTDLFENPQLTLDKLAEIYADMNYHLQSASQQEYNFVYDQIVSQGELLSTLIVADYLKQQGLPVTYKDARGLIATDNTYREAKVNWGITEYRIEQALGALLRNDEAIVVTQGFIGQSSEQHTTTLGREGSDYTAAIFAFSLQAQEVSIWKDVPGVLNADPKYFSDAQLLKQLSYKDAIELAYYGATVIHPKTIKPLQNKKIALRVRSFIHPDQEGTLINEKEPMAVIPSFIFKVNQALISISPLDFSFIMEENLHEIFGLLAKYRVKVNLMQHSAISFQVCVDNDERKMTHLLPELKQRFSIQWQDQVELITVRYYNQATIDRLLNEKKLLVEQKNNHTIRMAVLPQ